MAGMQEIAGHVFLSYIREDSDDADRLERVLEASGVPVWRDTAELWPGEDWRAKIRQAIVRDALVFVACFSSRSLARESSFQNEELTLAIEQLRLRKPGVPWLIPVRFDNCELPDLYIGPDRTLTSIQRADLFGYDGGEAASRLVESVQRLLAPPSQTEGPGDASLLAAYDALDKATARVFRLLTVIPGPDMETSTVAVTADITESRARKALARLRKSHLVEAVPDEADRWKLADAARSLNGLMSSSRAADDGREQARDRVLSRCHSMAVDLNEVLAKPGYLSGSLSARSSVLDLFAVQSANLIAAAAMAAATGRDEVAADLPLALARFLHERCSPQEAQRVITIGLEAARRAGDRLREAFALDELGLASLRAGRSAEAVALHQSCLAIVRELGDVAGQGSALNSIARALNELHRFRSAEATAREAVEIFRQIGDRRSESRALRRLGRALLGDLRMLPIAGFAYEHDIALLRESLAITLDIGDRHGEGASRYLLGIALFRAARYEDAADAEQAAVAISRETGDRKAERMSLQYLGRALQRLGRHEEAILAHQQDLAICRQMLSAQAVAGALGDLGDALRRAERFDEAVAAQQESLTISRNSNNVPREAYVLDQLGLALQGAGRTNEAIIAHTDAASLLREIDNWRDEVIVLRHLNTALRTAGRIEEAESVSETISSILHP